MLSLKPAGAKPLYFCGWTCLETWMNDRPEAQIADAPEMEIERDRLKALNAEMLVALRICREALNPNGYWEAEPAEMGFRLASIAIAKAEGRE